jgi:hypothetical protein
MPGKKGIAYTAINQLIIINKVFPLQNFQLIDNKNQNQLIK